MLISKMGLSKVSLLHQLYVHPVAVKERFANVGFLYNLSTLESRLILNPLEQDYNVRTLLSYWRATTIQTLFLKSSVHSIELKIIQQRLIIRICMGKLLITGGAGFIGSRLAKIASNDGWEICS